MKVYGKANIFSGGISSNVSEESDKAQNIIAADKLSEFDVTGLDREISIIDKDSHSLTTFNNHDQDWDDAIITGDPVATESIRNIAVREKTVRLFNASTTSNHLAIQRELFDFGQIGSPIDFVIDFYISADNISNDATILYNGKQTGQVDLEINKNLLITTRGATLIKDPAYQSDPTLSSNGLNGYIVCHRPFLKSTNKMKEFHKYHVALIRSGDTTYLAINGRIEDSAPSVEYFFYDVVKIATGYVDESTSRIIDRIRVTKGTDLGWTDTFTPPDYDDIESCDFVLHSTDVNDIKGNYSVDVIGTGGASTINFVIPEFISDPVRKTIVNITKDVVTGNDHAWLILVENPNIQDVEIHVDDTVDHYYLQSGYDIGNINRNVFSHDGNIAIFNAFNPNHLPLIMRQCSDGWNQVVDVPNSGGWARLLGSHPLYDYNSRDGIAQDSNYFRRPYAINATSAQSFGSIQQDVFVDQNVFREDVGAIRLGSLGSDYSVRNCNDSQYQNSRMDFIIRFNETPSGYVNFAYQYTPSVGSYWNRTNASRQLEFNIGYYGGTLTAGRNTCFTTSLPLNEWCFVSIRTICTLANTTTAKIYSYIRGLETGTVYQNYALIGNFSHNAGGYWYRYFYYNRSWRYYTGYSYSRGITQFSRSSGLDIIGYRRIGTSANAANSYPKSIFDFFTN